MYVSFYVIWTDISENKLFVIVIVIVIVIGNHGLELINAYKQNMGNQHTLSDNSNLGTRKWSAPLRNFRKKICSPFTVHPSWCISCTLHLAKVQKANVEKLTLSCCQDEGTVFVNTGQITFQREQCHRETEATGTALANHTHGHWKKTPLLLMLLFCFCFRDDRVLQTQSSNEILQISENDRADDL